MATTHKWTLPSTTLTSYLATELNSLANAAYSAASAAIDNTSNLHQWMAVQVHLASLTPTGSPYVALYLLPSFDNGTTYVDGGGSTAPPASTLVAVFDLSTSTGAKERAATFPIPPAKFKLVLLNTAGPALASSGNTVTGNTFAEQDV